MFGATWYNTNTLASERSDLEKERRQMAADRSKHNIFLDHAESMRSKWTVEVGEHDKERKRWDVERKEREEEREHARREWNEERKRWDLERREREAEERQRQREKEERKREEEQRKRANLYWEDLKAMTKCVRYGTREYTAKLANIPQGYDPLKGCLETEGDIHGVKMLPDHCENKVGSSAHIYILLVHSYPVSQGVWGGMWGHWTIDFDEPSCRPWWDHYVDKVRGVLPSYSTYTPASIVFAMAENASLLLVCSSGDDKGMAALLYKCHGA